ncbi:hypothetical protein GCM10010472_69430 [Pseudonocardia halophobica]|uniref:Uncharacterized protein n=1 Tax=Pseudonocardia halophobica TaxID=29401 RepID=A0A9W6P133_9PSEU|nr:hypothetical protein [Pseudonocardia halophobica]GLL15852.1 hypothetical protein GCM10017577_70060 [Pseudonocardia halophobica]
MSLTTVQDDALSSTRRRGLPPRWFDRFYVNAHAGSSTPFFMVGAGVYPGEDVVDGYAVVVTGGEQINLRVSAPAGPGDLPTAVGPLFWETVEPLRTWRVRLSPNESGLACDLTWTARTAPWECAPVRLDDGAGTMLEFDHAFQSGRHSGWIEIDGSRHTVDRWTGQRDRSRGRRPATARQGLHLWVQAQFVDESIAFMHDLDRKNRPTLLDGAVLRTDGSVDPIVDAGHDLRFAEDLEALPGRLEVSTRSGREIALEVDPAATRGGFLAGAGYGSFHGVRHGGLVVEHDRWDLADPARVPRAMGYPLTDRLAAYVRVEDGTRTEGSGVFEFAHTRSPAYRYAPAVLVR